MPSNVSKVTTVTTAPGLDPAGRVILVSRHPGALGWMRRVLGTTGAIELAHLDEDHFIRAGDLVFGVLPVRWIAHIRAIGASAFSIEVVLPPNYRGRELTSDELDALGARLVEYDACGRGECGPATLKRITPSL